jgi:hypothetical protein
MELTRGANGFGPGLAVCLLRQGDKVRYPIGVKLDPTWNTESTDAMKSYLVTLVDQETGDLQRIVVQSDCSHNMQEFVDGLVDLKLAHPIVVDIDEQVVRHLPLVNPT